MKNENMPAMPIVMDDGSVCEGLSKLEHFAGLAMQGVLASGCGAEFKRVAKEAGVQPLDVVSTYSVESAKALLAQLEAEK